MLYQSTRNKIDTYTAHKVLHSSLKAGEGQVLPMVLPALAEEEMRNILSLPFADVVFSILDKFFPGKITAWDISCALGKTPVRVDAIGQKILMGVLWDNRANSAEYMITGIYNKLCGSENEKPTACARVAITISLLFALFAEAKRQGIDQLDFAAAAGDLETVFAAWYAKRMGLPIGTILCACNENSNCWDFLHRGNLNTAAQVVNTALPEMDIQLPDYLESLLYSVFGAGEVACYVSAVASGKVYSLDEEQLLAANDGIYACVVGSNRVGDVISSVKKTDNYSLDVYAAAVYGGVQDYRAKTGKHNFTLVWANHRP